MIAVEEMDLTHLDKDFKLHLKANKSIDVNDKNFWTKLRYINLFMARKPLSKQLSLFQTFIAGRNFEVEGIRISYSLSVLF